MVIKYGDFLITEGKYTDIKNEYNSLGEYVEHLMDTIEDKELFSSILGDYVKKDAKKYKTNTFNEGDYVLVEYWYNDMSTPVKILEKKGRFYKVTHNIEDSSIPNAPDETIEKSHIIDHYRKTKDNQVEKNIDTDIRIANAINLMNEYDQMLLVNKIEKTFGISENTKFELNDTKNTTLLGKSGFNSFLKAVTALSLPDIESDKDNCPNDFFNIFVSEKLNREKLLRVFKRFKSMVDIHDVISDSNDAIRVYFGLKFDVKLFVEYGVILGETRYEVGEYKLTKKYWEMLKERDNKYLKKLQKQISSIDISDLKKLMNIKSDITNFSPGYFHEKSNPYIEDNMLVQGYYGSGEWNSGSISEESLSIIKKELKKWVSSNKWAKEVLFKAYPDKFWVWVNIKIK